MEKKINTKKLIKSLFSMKNNGELESIVVSMLTNALKEQNIEYINGEFKEIKNISEPIKTLSLNRGAWLTCIAPLRTFEVGKAYQCICTGNIRDDYNDDIVLQHPEKYFKQWSIQDVKPGDILAAELSDTDPAFPFVMLTKNYYKSKIGYRLSSYCSVEAGTGKLCMQPFHHNIDIVHPATEFQKQYLYTVLKNNGYIWDRNSGYIWDTNKKEVFINSIQK